MRHLLKTGRNIAFAMILWAGTAPAAPAAASALWCDQVPYFEDWSGMCSGAFDACGYFRQECEYYCYQNYGGYLCSGDILWCSGSNHGTGPDPNYCLDSGWCQCVTE